MCKRLRKTAKGFKSYPVPIRVFARCFWAEVEGFNFHCTYIRFVSFLGLAYLTLGVCPGVIPSFCVIFCIFWLVLCDVILINSVYSSSFVTAFCLFSWLVLARLMWSPNSKVCSVNRLILLHIALRFFYMYNWLSSKILPTLLSFSS